MSDRPPLSYAAPPYPASPYPVVVAGPRYPFLVGFPAALFAAAFVADLAYWRAPSVLWNTFAIWLITGGLLVAVPVALIGLADLAGGRRRHLLTPSWHTVFGDALAIGLSIVNAFVHSRDGYTAVVPTGVTLSALVLVILLLSRDGVWSSRIASRGRNAGLALLSLVLFVCGLGAERFFSGAVPPQVEASTQYGPNPVLPSPHQYLLPPMHIAPNVAWGATETPTVPSGLKIQALAQGFEHPRSITVLPNGDVLVVEASGPHAPVNRPKDVIMGWVKHFAGSASKDVSRITLIRGGDTTPVTRSVFLDHLNAPFGVVLVGGDLYVANTDAIIRYPYTEGETSITAPGIKLTDLPGGPIDHHWTKSLVASQDGTKLYVGVGSNSNITENGIGAEMNRADILEVDRASGRFRVFASGLRNPNGLQFEPSSGKLWAVVNERDELGPNLVPDYLTSVQDGAFYGWPYSYYGQHVDPRVQPQRPDMVAKAIAPDYALSSHVAPLGMVFTAASKLPAPFNAGALVGEHGSWDRTPLSGYKVVYVPFADGKPSGLPQDVVTGFLNGKNQARGRPVGLAIDKSGALLIADDLGNSVWRVSAAQQSAANTH